MSGKKNFRIAVIVVLYFSVVYAVFKGYLPNGYQYLILMFLSSIYCFADAAWFYREGRKKEAFGYLIVGLGLLSAFLYFSFLK